MKLYYEWNGQSLTNRKEDVCDVRSIVKAEKYSQICGAACIGRSAAASAASGVIGAVVSGA